LGHLASVIGLAPIRPGLKDRLRELLCIHGRRKWIAGLLDYWIDATRVRNHGFMNPSIQ